MVEPLALKYRAFISYSHADTASAKWLHRAIESFHIDKDLVGRETSNGPIPKTLRPIFRDRDDFTAGHTLTDQTLAALDASHALIVICSPHSAKSRYVTEELRLFKSRHPERPVVPLIVGGKRGDPELECFPPSLKFKLDANGQITNEPIEVLAADAREEGDGKNLGLAKVVAGLLGVSSDDVFRRAERERRRKGRVRNGIVAVLAILVVVASGSAVYAWQQLKTNEAFLTATLKTATEIVDEAVAQADTYGIPRTATVALLTKAEGLFDNMALLGRPTPELQYQKAWMLIQFARNYEILGETAKQKARAEEAHRLIAELASDMPDDPEKLHTLAVTFTEKGDALIAQGDTAGAEKSYRDSLAIAERLVRLDPSNALWQRDLSISYDTVGDVLKEQDDLAGALKFYQDSLTIRDRLAKGEPNNAGWQSDLSISYDNVGDMLEARGDLGGALKFYQDGLTIRDRLAKAEPNNAGWQRDLSVSYEKVGDTLKAQGKLAEALTSYKDNLAIRDRLTKADPSNADWQRDLSVSNERLGDIYLTQGNAEAALEQYRASLERMISVRDADSSNADLQRFISVTLEKIGNVMMVQGDLSGALKSYQDDFAIADRLAKSDPGNAGWQRDLAISYGHVARVLVQRGESAQALDEYRRAREIIARLKQQSPDDATLPNDLAWFDAEIAKLEQTRAPGWGLAPP